MNLAQDTGDGLADCANACPQDAANDEDQDSVCGDSDLCPGTPSVDTVPTGALRPGRFADVDGDRIFETRDPYEGIVDSTLTLADTHGCDFGQMLACDPKPRKGEIKNGCADAGGWGACVR